MSNLQQALDYAHQNRNRFLEALVDALKIPSISTDAVYDKEVQRAAEWMADYLKGLGIANVEIMPTEGGHPVVRLEALDSARRLRLADPVELQPEANGRVANHLAECVIDSALAQGELGM